MSSFKRFNSSNNSTDYNGSEVFEEGTLTWDGGNGLRLHDGYTNGGNSVGGNNYSGLSAIHDMVFSGGSSANNGRFIQQVNTNQVQWGDGVQLWKSGFNVDNPEIAVPGLTISFYGNNILLINSSGADATFTWAGRKITSSSVESLHSAGATVLSTANTTITSLAAGHGDTVILDHVCNVDQNQIYRVTIMSGWSGTTHGQIVIERLM